MDLEDSNKLATNLALSIAVDNKLEFIDIPNKELFKTGFHNGINYTAAKLKEMVECTNQVIKEFNMRCPVKIGHSTNQAFSKDFKSKFEEALNKEEMPAFGHIENIRLENGVILGDLKNIPKPLFNLIENKIFPKHSIETWTNYIDSTGKQIGDVISSIALLGSSQPCISNLYSSNSDTVTLMEDDTTMTKELEEKLEAEKLATAKAEEATIAVNKVLEETKSALAEANKTIEEAVKAKEEVALKADVDGLLADGLIMPAEIEAVKQVFSSLNNSMVQVNFSRNDGEKVITPSQAFKAILENRKGLNLFKAVGEIGEKVEDNLTIEEQAILDKGEYTKEQIIAGR